MIFISLKKAHAKTNLLFNTLTAGLWIYCT